MQGKTKESPDSLAAFQHRLSLLAGRRRLKQAEIARRLSTAEHVISPQRVGGWFQGRHFPGGEVEHALAALLGVSRDWLIEGKESTAPTELPSNIVAVREGSPEVEGQKEKVRSHIHELLLAAKNDPQRIAWIIEQLKEHVAIPKNWRTLEDTNRRAYELAAQRAAQSDREAQVLHRRSEHTEKSA